jgi:hypothetical protein
MPRFKKIPPKETILVRSHTLPPTTAKALRRLSQDASDYAGWTISNSAIVRGLVRLAAAQGALWQREQLYPFIEQEIQDGTFWGKKK